MQRIAFAFRAFFAILFAGKLPGDIAKAYGFFPSKQQPAQQAKSTPQAKPAPQAPQLKPSDGALQMLNILQRDSRLIDFLMEDISPYSDDQVGAAVRNIHDQCRDSLDRYVHLSPVIDLHALGFLDCVVTTTGILARKIDNEHLYHLEWKTLRNHGTPAAGWQEVFKSEMGNIVLVERRVLQYRLVLTCERGLVEIDVSHLPDLVIETARVPMQSGFGVVGRIDNGAFAVTVGTIESWGLTNMSPAMLVGSPIASLLELPRMLRAMPVAVDPDDPTTLV